MKNFVKNIGAFLSDLGLDPAPAAVRRAVGGVWTWSRTAVNDYKFWESPISRLLTISGLILMSGPVHGLCQLAGRGAQAGPQRTVPTVRSGCVRPRRPSKAQDEGASRTPSTTLKTSSVYRGRSERWRNDLPWYLLIAKRFIVERPLCMTSLPGGWPTGWPPTSRATPLIRRPLLAPWPGWICWKTSTGRFVRSVAAGSKSPTNMGNSRTNLRRLRVQRQSCSRCSH